MILKGKELKTTEDFMSLGIDQCDTKEEARAFIRQYVLETLHARFNIGYLAGYYSNDKKKRIFDWFDVVHPVLPPGSPYIARCYTAALGSVAL